jgi:F-type H+-transporting ATPase subunit h
VLQIKPEITSVLTFYLADMVQDIYLQHLKNYKPTAVKPGDEKGHVHEFKAPKTPASPEESNLANDLKAYEDQAVEVEGREAGAVEEVEEDWFEEEVEEDEAKH